MGIKQGIISIIMSSLILIFVAYLLFYRGIVLISYLTELAVGLTLIAFGILYWGFKPNIDNWIARTRASKLVFNCFVSKEKEQIGFELRSDKKLTKVEVFALVEGIESGRMILPFIDMGVLNYRFAILSKDESVKFLLAGEPPKAPNDKSTYNQLNKITPMILNGHSHKMTLLVRCNELQREIRKNFHLRFNSWNEVEFFEI